MTAQTAGRNFQLRAGGAKPEELPVPITLVTGQKLYRGSLVAVTTAGQARPARTVSSNSDVIVGFSERDVDGTTAGTKTEGVRRGIIDCANDSGDPVTLASLGRSVYAVDDQTVSAGSASSTRVVAGKFLGFDEDSGRPLVEVG